MMLIEYRFVTKVCQFNINISPESLSLIPFCLNSVICINILYISITFLVIMNVINNLSNRCILWHEIISQYLSICKAALKSDIDITGNLHFNCNTNYIYVEIFITSNNVLRIYKYKYYEMKRLVNLPSGGSTSNISRTKLSNSVAISSCITSFLSVAFIRVRPENDMV